METMPYVNIPTNYNWSTVKVDGYQLKSCSDVIWAACHGVGVDLGDIIDAMNALQLAWVGDGDGAADRAADFNTRWKACMVRLFGTDDQPDAGVFNVLNSGVSGAAANYGSNETELKMMFQHFAQALTAPTAEAETQDVPQSITDEVSGDPSLVYHTTAVNESGLRPNWYGQRR